MGRRLRRTGKWVGLAATLSIAGVYAVSTVNSVSWFRRGNGGIGAASGILVISWDDSSAGQQPGWATTRHEPAIYWRFKHDVSRFGNHIAQVPLWAPLFAVGLPTAWLWRRDRRADPRNRPGHCGGCGYDMAGIAVGQPCPECGASPFNM